MFGSNRKKNSSHVSTDIETIIGKNTVIKGVISGNGNIRIDGKIEGEIDSGGDVVIGDQGQVTASIKAVNVLISGTVNGNVQASGKLSISSTGRLVGDVDTALLSIDEGATFKGSSSMNSQKPPEPKPEQKIETKKNK